ncbi:MAG: low specificity L-threonine aldolase [Alphaproteobacteria bacterium]|nr:low specificity L-threonine aldolase [Alphaproteobacteria bacterium]MBT5860902.1 low specificity L-threonine aldolase [Alphaproteobacteria bacterium]
MDFRSDNTSGVAPQIMAAIADANSGSATPYGDDDATDGLTALFAEVFEHDVAIFPLGTGTAANALALSAIAPPYGAVYCHAHAHIVDDECGAPELFTGGARLVGLDGDHGKISPIDLAATIEDATPHGPHNMQPAAVSLSQATEAGTLYSVEDIMGLAGVAKAAGIGVHMDGARFANAVVGSGASPADLTWRAGVDVLSFGATKNGAMGAEAVVFFDVRRAADFARRRKRGGQLFSKMRFISAQLAAYLTDDLWLANATHANDQATHMSDALVAINGIDLMHPTQANEVFVAVPAPMADGLDSQGFQFHRWSLGKNNAVGLRLVASFETTSDQVVALVSAAQKLAV